MMKILFFVSFGILPWSQSQHIYFIASVYRKYWREWSLKLLNTHIHISIGIRLFPLQYHILRRFLLRKNNMIFDVVFIPFIINLTIKLFLLSIWFKVSTIILKYILSNAMVALAISVNVSFIFIINVYNFSFRIFIRLNRLFFVRLFGNYRRFDDLQTNIQKCELNCNLALITNFSVDLFFSFSVIHVKRAASNRPR